jgi:hypothetical protein
VGDLDSLGLSELLDQVREEYDVATWNEQKILSGGSFMYSPSPLQLMAEAFRTLDVLMPLVEARRGALPLDDGASTAFVWIGAFEAMRCRCFELRAVRHAAWPSGNDYSGPATYFHGNTQRTFEVATAAAPQVEKIASDKKLALVVLRGDRIEAVY